MVLPQHPCLRHTRVMSICRPPFRLTERMLWAILAPAFYTCWKHARTAVSLQSMSFGGSAHVHVSRPRSRLYAVPMLNLTRLETSPSC
ncbi:hypothetical protein BJV74DRAFT_869743 [Russula compacta]|nr:hypothetical protein BJV74DRAFT_869743 [Russula compacta]